MFATFSDPFETLLTLQRALESRIASDWMGRGTAARGSFPPINIFQKDDNFVAVVRQGRCASTGRATEPCRDDPQAESIFLFRSGAAEEVTSVLF